MDGSWFPVPIAGNRGTSSKRFLGTRRNYWELGVFQRRRQHDSASPVRSRGDLPDPTRFPGTGMELPGTQELQLILEWIGLELTGAVILPV